MLVKVILLSEDEGKTSNIDETIPGTTYSIVQNKVNVPFV